MEETKTFEEKLTRLEKITGDINNANVSMSQSIELLEEGLKLVKSLNEELDNAQKTVEVLLADGTTQEFEAKDE